MRVYYVEKREDGPDRLADLSSVRMTSEAPSLSVQVLEKQEGGPEHWRFELRVRYLPSDLHQLYDKDRVTFHFYYHQVS